MIRLIIIKLHIIKNVWFLTKNYEAHKETKNMAHSQGVKNIWKSIRIVFEEKTGYGLTRQILYINCFKYAERD